MISEHKHNFRIHSTYVNAGLTEQQRCDTTIWFIQQEKKLPSIFDMSNFQ